MTKPIRTTNRNCRTYIQTLTPFTNSNGQLYALWVSPCIYAVYSYGPHWPLFVYDANLSLWYENEDRASMTTSHHRSYAHPLTPTELRSCGWLKTYINGQRFDRKAA